MIIPLVHWNEVKKIKGISCYKAEITTSAGTHGIYLEKRKVDEEKVLVKNPKKQG